VDRIRTLLGGTLYSRYRKYAGRAGEGGEGARLPRVGERKFKKNEREGGGVSQLRSSRRGRLARREKGGEKGCKKRSMERGLRLEEPCLSKKASQERKIGGRRAGEGRLPWQRGLKQPRGRYGLICTGEVPIGIGHVEKGGGGGLAGKREKDMAGNGRGIGGAGG